MRKKTTVGKTPANTESKTKIWKLWAGIISFFAITATIFGTLADGKEIFSGCNSKTDKPEKLNLASIKYKKYEGRFGCSFLYPSDWEPWVDPEFASMDKLILHPTNPEIGIQYFDAFDMHELSENEENINDLAAENLAYLKENKRKVKTVTFLKKSYPKCDYVVEMGKIKYLSQTEEGLKKVVVRIFTRFEGHEYILQVMCPEDIYPSYEELLHKILASVEFDCANLDDEF